jgi:hypothetical protein
MKVSFQYPTSGFTTTILGPDTVNGFPVDEKRIEITKNATGTKLVLYYSTGAFGCTGEQMENAPLDKVDALFKSNDGRENIARVKTQDDTGSYVVYTSYSSSTKDQGHRGMCGVDIMALSTGDIEGYFFTRLQGNNVAADYADFDTIIKSLKRG